MHKYKINNYYLEDMTFYKPGEKQFNSRYLSRAILHVWQPWNNKNTIFGLRFSTDTQESFCTPLGVPGPWFEKPCYSLLQMLNYIEQ